jgi:hypothetical protein
MCGGILTLIAPALGPILTTTTIGQPPPERPRVRAPSTTTGRGAEDGRRERALVSVLAIISLCLFGCFASTMGVAMFIVIRTGETRGIRDLAALVAAFGKIIAAVRGGRARG